MRERHNASGDRHTARMTIVILLSATNLTVPPKKGHAASSTKYLQRKICKGAASSRAAKPQNLTAASSAEVAIHRTRTVRFTLISQYFGNSNLKLPSAILPLTCPGF